MLSDGLQPLSASPAAAAGNTIAGLTPDASVQPNQTTLNPQVAVTGNNQPIANGSTTPSLANDTAFGTTVPGVTLTETYTIINGGTAPLAVGLVSIGGIDAADFTVETQPGNTVAVGANTTFTVQFTAATIGTASATVSFTTNDPKLSGPFTFAIGSVVINPNARLVVSAGGQTITDGSTTPTVDNGTAFATTVVGTTSQVTYSIGNGSASTLTLGTVSISGPNASEFTVTKQPNSSVSSRGSTTFTVQFKPTTASPANSPASATISFAQNDPSLPDPFTFAISGVATIKQPHINVTAGGQMINDGSQDLFFQNGTGFSTTAVGNSTSVTYSIANSGTAPLTLGTVSTVETDAADFIVTKQPNSVVAVGGSTTFTILFKPTAVGDRSTIVRFADNDPKFFPFDFIIGGIATSIQPQMTVSAGGQLIAGGGTSPEQGNGTEFNSTLVGSSTYVTYSIANNGSGPLTVGTVSISGADAGNFTVTKQPGSSVAVGGSTTFTIRFNPTAVGVPSATVSFADNDPNHGSPFTFKILGVAPVKAPFITVSAGGGTIPDGSTTPTTGDGTSFNSTVVGNSTSVTYSIANSGTAALTPGTVTISGPNAGEFTVTKQPNSSVAPLGSTTFTVQFKPTASGTPTATVSFNENDPFQPNPFTFAINGVATAAPAVISSNVVPSNVANSQQQANNSSVPFLTLGTSASQAKTASVVNYNYAPFSPTVVTPPLVPSTTPSVGSASTGSSATVTSTAYLDNHGRHRFQATDAAVSDFDLADLSL